MTNTQRKGRRHKSGALCPRPGIDGEESGSSGDLDRACSSENVANKGGSLYMLFKVPIGGLAGMAEAENFTATALTRVIACVHVVAEVSSQADEALATRWMLRPITEIRGVHAGTPGRQEAN